ncbi:MAG: SemiSWEET transporter [Candidatus Omnitrophica bacterium]|nr:SemiSWEET transporter [Candidatus Omnitrophota bacterium]
MGLTTWVGCVAATLTTLAFIPQVVKTWRTRRTQDISLAMYAVFTFGVGLWLAYGVLLGEWPIIAANAIVLIFSAIVLVLKIKHG